MSTAQVLVLILVVIVLGVAGWFLFRHQRLRRRFGSEYEQVVTEHAGFLATDRELRERERRHGQLELRELDPAARERYAQAWQDVQAEFVADPAAAVNAGDELVTKLVADRGYPTENFDDQLSYLSVEHARTLEHYRDAHEISERNKGGEASTEDLRQALVHYRALFADLLGTDPVPAASETATAPTDKPAPAPRTAADDTAPDSTARSPRP